MSVKIELMPIGTVAGGRADMRDDGWAEEHALIILDDRFDSGVLTGLDQFSHALIVFQLHKVRLEKIVAGARHPRNNPSWPKVGIFAQRAKNRPNRLAVSACKIEGVGGRTLKVSGLDAIDGSPVLDIKPYMKGFDPQEPVTEPDWASDLMQGYWK